MMMPSPKAVSFLVALSAAAFCISVALSTVDAQVELMGSALHKLKNDCPAKHLTEENFELETQASGGMTSGNWLIYFSVPRASVSSVDGQSRQAADEIIAFDAFVCHSAAVLDEYQVVPAYVLCDESLNLCARFNTEGSAGKLVILSGGRMYPYPAGQSFSVNDIKVFVSTFRRIESRAVPPPLTGRSIWGQLILLLGGVIVILILRSISRSWVSVPPPPPPRMTACYSKSD